MSKNPFRNKNVVITGGSSGIGLATAKEFARYGAKLFIIARNVARLERARHDIMAEFEIPVQVFSANVSNKVQIESTIRLIGENHGGIDVLINNAGTWNMDYFENLTIDQFEESINVNYLGSLYCTKYAWPYLKASKGRVGFVSSVAGYTGIIGHGTYGPTKFAMTGLAESLRMEGKKDKISITIIFPPDTDTATYRDTLNDLPMESAALAENASVVTPDHVARLLVKGVAEGKFEVLCNFESRFYKTIKNTFPKAFYWFIDRVATSVDAVNSSAIAN